MLRKLWIPTLCLLLCGCSPAGVDMDAVADHYAAMTDAELEVTVAVTAGTCLSFDLRVQRGGEEDLVTILAPEGVAGISARIGPDRTALEYRGAVAETLLPGVPGFTPCDAVTGLLDDLASAVPVSAALVQTDQGETIQLCYSRRLTEGYTGEKLVWLAPDYSLRRAEFFLQGGLVMTLQVK